MDIELDILSFILVTIILLLFLLPILFPSEPDTFPFLLNNQSTASRVRQPGESALYRHRDVPHGYPLITGLALRKGYEAPRNGDIRDIWDLGEQKGTKLAIVRGGKIDTWELAKKKNDMLQLGEYLRNVAGEGTKVAVFLPNTIEHLLSIFGSAFYGLTLVQIPFTSTSLSPPILGSEAIELLRVANPDVLILPAGIALTDIQSSSNLKQVIVVDIAAAPHLDWKSEIGNTQVKSWNDILQSSEKDIEPAKDLASVTTVEAVVKSEKGYQSVQFTHLNTIAAVASQLKLLPRDHHFSEKDTFLPLTSFADTTAHTLLLATIASGSTVILHSLTDAQAQINLSTQVNPTILVPTIPVLDILVEDILSHRRISLLNSVRLSYAQTKLSSGRLPKSGVKVIKNAISKNLRLLYVTVSSTSERNPWSSSHLDLLRAGLGAHVVYALTTPFSFGPITQTQIHDYRADEKLAHYGAPVGGAQVKLTGWSGKNAYGDVEIEGPIVVGQGWQTINIKGRWRGDGCLDVKY